MREYVETCSERARLMATLAEVPDCYGFLRDALRREIALLEAAIQTMEARARDEVRRRASAA